MDEVHIRVDEKDPTQVDIVEVRGRISAARQWHGTIAIVAAIASVGAIIHTFYFALARMNVTVRAAQATPADVIGLTDDAFYGWLIAAIGLVLFAASHLRSWRLMGEAIEADADLYMEEPGNNG